MLREYRQKHIASERNSSGEILNVPTVMVCLMETTRPTMDTLLRITLK